MKRTFFLVTDFTSSKVFVILTDMSLRQDSLYRYHVPRQHVDLYIEQTEVTLQEVVASWDERVEQALQDFLFRLEAELGATLEISPEALFWMRDNVALVLAEADCSDDFREREEALLSQTLYLLDALD